QPTPAARAPVQAQDSVTVERLASSLLAGTSGREQPLVPGTRCRGYTPRVPAPFSCNWAFQRHSIEGAPFVSTTCGLVSLQCTGVAAPGGSPCKPCSDLEHCGAVKRWVKAANDPLLHKGSANYTYLTHSQVVARAQHHRGLRDDVRLQHFNDERHCAAITRQLGNHKRFLLAVSEGNIPRLHALVRTALRHGNGLNAIMAKIGESLEGTYSAKGYQNEPDAVDMACLVLHIGGPLLLSAMHKANLLPSVSWVLHQHKAPKMRGFIAGHDLEETVAYNLKSMVLSMGGKAAGCAWHLMADELAVECKPQYDPKTNTV
ncbi:hypothetical protein Agub_g15992, partial [Astrephomene gubernaculifera]